MWIATFFLHEASSLHDQALQSSAQVVCRFSCRLRREPAPSVAVSRRFCLFPIAILLIDISSLNHVYSPTSSSSLSQLASSQTYLFRLQVVSIFIVISASLVTVSAYTVNQRCCRSEIESSSMNLDIKFHEFSSLVIKLLADLKFVSNLYDCAYFFSN